MKCINLNTETVKILGIHYSYDKNKRQNENFVQHITKIENVLKVWRMRKLTILGRIAVFKTLDISKINTSCLNNQCTFFYNRPSCQNSKRFCLAR